MFFQFAPAIQAGITAGKYLQVFSNGVPISMVRDTATGQFVAHAIGVSINSSPLSPLVAASQFITSGAQMYQMHKGFTSVLNGLQNIQTSLGVLQATTALIGVGTVAGVALAAVNLHQTLKLRKEVEQNRLEVKNGFLDLKQALKDQGVEIRQIIEQVAQDIKFEQHRTILIRAYGLFIQAINRFRSAMQLQDVSRRNAEIDGVRGMLFEALADYTNPHLLEETCAAGQLRRLECAWAIEQAIIATYQVQNEMSAVSDRLSHLQDKIHENARTVIERCESHDELDFLFPEIIRIHNHDLIVLDSWQSHIEWMRSLPSSELKLLNSADFQTSENFTNSTTPQATTTLAVPPEQISYQALAPTSNGQASIVRTERGLTIAGTRITLYDVMDHLKAQYPPKFIRDAFNLTDSQIHVALSYIEAHQTEVEAEYQEILKAAAETRQYWEERNRERFARIAATPPRSEYEAVRAKIQERREQRKAKKQ
ncbi:MAG: DUF433 domain-containing protein [Scytonema sp. PMC 1069.18]|nr:DUF433 domain-containing protein [Scytonema sp. PMC 1069.18]MEC4882836.1 DUF433 domain-containing protein [Scytonema sp. PMC 1070.18]